MKLNTGLVAILTFASSFAFGNAKIVPPSTIQKWQISMDFSFNEKGDYVPEAVGYTRQENGNITTYRRAGEGNSPYTVQVKVTHGTNGAARTVVLTSSHVYDKSSSNRGVYQGKVIQLEAGKVSSFLSCSDINYGSIAEFERAGLTPPNPGRQFSCIQYSKQSCGTIKTLSDQYVTAIEDAAKHVGEGKCLNGIDDSCRTVARNLDAMYTPMVASSTAQLRELEEVRKTDSNLNGFSEISNFRRTIDLRHLALNNYRDLYDLQKGCEYLEALFH